VRCSIEGLDASGRVDVLITLTEPDGTTRRIVYELKSIGGFGYKMAVGERAVPEGPRHSAKVQGALGALALDADDLVVGLLATEAISKGAAKRNRIPEHTRVVAEWTFPREEWEPLALAEVARMKRVLELVDDGSLAPCAIPDPDIPTAALVVDPNSGRWEVRQDDAITDTGSTWMCGYCNWQETCVAVGESGRVSIEAARERVADRANHLFPGTGSQSATHAADCDLVQPGVEHRSCTCSHNALGGAA
jgi:hypothetical protein